MICGEGKFPSLQSQCLFVRLKQAPSSEGVSTGWWCCNPGGPENCSNKWGTWRMPKMPAGSGHWESHREQHESFE